MLGTGDVSDARGRIAGCMDRIMEVVISFLPKQEDQRNQLAELQKASNAQDENLEAWQTRGNSK